MILTSAPSFRFRKVLDSKLIGLIVWLQSPFVVVVGGVAVSMDLLEVGHDTLIRVCQPNPAKKK